MYHKPRWVILAALLVVLAGCGTSTGRSNQELVEALIEAERIDDFDAKQRLIRTADSRGEAALPAIREARENLRLVELPDDLEQRGAMLLELEFIDVTLGAVETAIRGKESSEPLPMIGVEEFESDISEYEAVAALRAAGAYIARFDGKVDAVDLRSTGGVSDNTFRKIGAIKTVTLIYANGMPITDEGARALAALHDLSTLTLDNTQVTDRTLAYLAKAEKLYELSIDGTNVSDKGLKQIESLPNLQKFSASHCEGITDQGLSSVAKMQRLWSLNLEGTSITKAGVMQLASLKKLKTLLLGDNIPEATQLALKSQLPLIDR